MKYITQVPYKPIIAPEAPTLELSTLNIKVLKFNCDLHDKSSKRKYK